MTKYKNMCVQISCYATLDLNKTLLQWGEDGFKLVNTLIAKNRYGTDVMYCFFTKDLEDNE